MSDVKRVHFETIGDKKSSNTTKPTKTIRLDLKLFETNADSFPKFNYSTLFRLEKVILQTNSRTEQIIFFLLNFFLFRFFIPINNFRYRKWSANRSAFELVCYR